MARAGAVAALLLLASSQAPSAAAEAPAEPRAFTGDVRDLPPAPAPAPGATPREGPPRRQVHPPAVPLSEMRRGGRDPLLDRQALVSSRRGATRAFAPPGLDIDGQGDTGVVPPDPSGDVGVSYYVQAINGASGSPVTIYDKATGAIVAGPFALESLWPGSGPCSAGLGDPIVLYDVLAGRWLLSEFASTGNHLCVYISKTGDPVSGGWYAYDFSVPEFPDYPKYAVWPDAYYVSSNESSPAAYALDRPAMLAGLPARFQRKTAPSLGGFGFQALTPADLDGTTPPPAGAPGIFLRHVDDELHDPGASDPSQDFLEIWEFHADFLSPGGSTFSLAATIPVAEFESELCGLGSNGCFPQPGTTTLLDPIAEVVMWRVQYRNFGSHESLVGTFVVDADGGSADHGGLRWFELRRSAGGPWTLYQEGTWAPDADHRWLGSVALDGSGNLALGYSVSGGATFPGIRYAGRLAADAPGTLTTGEQTIVAGAASQDFSSRWGDYSALTVDPVDECSFWYTSEYVLASGDWQTRIARFRFPSPQCTDAPPPVCGNGLHEAGEECDGADAAACPGLCQADCTCPAPVCGNGLREAGEQCDGADASACPGQCQSDCACPAPRCSASPEPSCLVADSAKLDANESKPGKERLRLVWRKVESATTQADFGDPVFGSTSVALCVYDDAGQLVADLVVDRAGDLCNGKSCWKAKGFKGYVFKDPLLASDGVKRIGYASGPTGRGRADALAKNNAAKGQMGLPTGIAAALSGSVSPRIQLVTRDGLCIGAALGGVTRDDGVHYSARLP